MNITVPLNATTVFRFRSRDTSGRGIRMQNFSCNGTPPAASPSITLADNGTQVTAANVAAGTTAHVLHKFSAAVTTANATLNTVAYTTAGTYQTADITNLKLRYSTDATLDAGDATLATTTTPAAAGAKTFGSLSQVINSGSTGYFFITADIAASPTAGRTISVNAIGTADLTFAAGSTSGSTTAGGAQTLQAASTPTITVAAGTLAFGNVQQNGTSSEQSYTVSGANLTANITITPPAGFEISTTSGSGFVANPSTLTLTQSGGTVANTTIYARFKPTSVTAYSANITHTSTGATTQNKAVTGTGIYSSASDIIRDTGFTEPSNIAYGSYQEANLTSSSLQVGSFTIRDGGASSDLDSSGTTLSAITFNVANHANLQRIALYDGTTELGEVAGGATAIFTGLSALAPDNGTKVLTLRASFNASVTDNQQISFTVASATAAAAGSGFAAANAGGAATLTTGDANRIEVTATKLAFSSVPSSVSLSANFTASVQALDANNNLDLDSTASVTITKASGAGTLTGGTAQALVAGEGSFTTLQIDTAGSFTIQASGGSLTPVTSSSITAANTTLANALDNSDLTWTTSGVSSWFYQTTTTHDGTDAARSGNIGVNSASNTLQTTVTGPGSLSFWWATDSESGYDYLYFFTNNTYTTRISGQGTNWAQLTYTLGSGVHTLRWVYAKDSSTSNGADAAWVDQVTWTPTQPNPSSFSATANGMNQIDLAWGPASGASGYVLVYDTDGTFTTPTDGVAAPAAGNAFGGGTVIYKGTGLSYNHGSLVACGEYYYKIWAYDATDKYSTGLEDLDVTDTISAPTVQPETSVLSTNFTANWLASSGADGYILDVATANTFSAGGSGVIESFETGLPTSYTTTTNYTLDSGAWSGQANGVIRGTTGVETGTYSLQLRSQTGAFITSPALVGGLGTLSFYVTSSTTGGGLQVLVSTDNGTNWTQVSGSPLTVGTTKTLQSFAVNDANVNRIQLYRTAATIYIDDMEWTPNSSGSEFVPGFQALDVGNVTSAVVTGLTAETAYYYRVRAYSAACGETVNSATEAVTTTAAISAPTVTTPTDTAITHNSATLGANVTSDGGAALSEKGVVWAITTAPDTGDNKVIHGNTFTVVFTVNATGLPGGTLIYYRGYAINSVDTTYSAEGSFYTEPTTQPTISIDSVTASSMNLSWSGGSGAGVIVVIRQGSAVAATPTDGMEHNASATYSSGADLGSSQYVVYRGIGSSVQVTGLSAGQTYHVAVFAYAGSGIAINYQQDTPGTDSDTTLATSEPVVSTPTVSAVTEAGATLGATVDTDGNAGPVSSRGTVWGTSANPTLNGLASGSGLGTFTHARTGLPAATLIYFRGYAVNGVGTGYSSDSTFYTEPSVQPVASFSLQNTNRFRLSWTGGDGAGTLVIVREGSAVGSGAPVDGTTYTADANFGGSGQSLGFGKVVYVGSGSQVDITGLNPNTAYHVALYEYAGSGAAINYQQDGPGTGNTSTTVDAEPTVPATGIYFATRNQASVVLNWTNGNGSARMVVMRAGAATTWTPVDGTSYTANADFGTAVDRGDGNKVVFLGTGTNQTVTGLSAATQYAVTVYELNGSGGSENYLLTTAPSASAYTLSAIPSFAASNLVVAVTNAYSMELQWARGDGNEVLVVAVLGSGTPTTPADGLSYSANAVFGTGDDTGGGSYVVYKGTGTNVTMTGLSANTTYSFRVYEFNRGVATTERYRVSATVTKTTLVDFEIAVSSGGNTITDGSTTPATANGTDFGGVLEAGAFAVTNTYTITNSGVLNMTVSTVSISGTHAADFTVGVEPTSPVAGKGFTTFAIVFNPSGLGARNATVSFTNADADESPFTFDITGEGTADTDGPTISKFAFGNGSAAVGTGNLPELLISEYVEEGNNKGLEIYNGTGVGIDLAAGDYEIRGYQNGNTSADYTVDLVGTIANGDVYVVTHATLAGSITNEDLVFTLQFNGNDAVRLYKGETIIDEMGTVGSSTYWAADVTLVRKSTVVTGNTTYTSAEWDSYPQNTYTYLGYHISAGGSTPAVTWNTTDGALFSGGYGITSIVQDAESGLEASGDGRPRYTLFNANSDPVFSNFFTVAYSAGDTNQQTLTASAPTGSASLLDIGTYTASFYINDAGGSLSTAGVAVVVTDDDSAAPVIGTFGLSGGNTLDLTLGNLTVTGRLADASGIDYTRSHVLVRNSGNTIIISNLLSGPAGADVPVSATFAPGVMTCGQEYTVTVVAFDNDLDRGLIDSLGVTGGVFTVTTIGQGTPGDAPVATNLVINGTAVSPALTLTDAVMASGAWKLGLGLSHPNGIQITADSPSIKITNSVGVAIDDTKLDLTNVAGTTTYFTNTMPGVAFVNVALGIHAVLWSATNTGACVSGVDDRNLIAGGTNLFTVVDDDSTAPSLSSFAVGGDRVITVSEALNGFNLTGLVADAVSGVDIDNNPPLYSVRMSNTVVWLIEDEPFDTTSAHGTTAASALAATISGLTVNCEETLEVHITAQDNDTDRPGDALSVTNVIFIDIEGSAGVPPVASALAINGTAAGSYSVTDVTFMPGGWTVALTITSPNLITTGADEPTFRVVNPAGVDIFSPAVMTFNTITPLGGDAYRAEGTVPAPVFAAVTNLGSFQVLWSARSSGLCYGEALGSATITGGNTFTVVDDDFTAPNIIDNFSVAGGVVGTMECGDFTTNLVPGDIAIIGMNTKTTSTENNDSFAFLALRPLPAGTQIKFTDKGWTSANGLYTSEGVLIWTATECVEEGTVVIWRNNRYGAAATTDPNSYTNVNIGSMVHQTPISSGSAFLPNTVGEQILAFQGSVTEPRLIYALHTGSWGWLRPASDGINVQGSASSLLPPGLVEGVTAVAVQNLNNVVIDPNTVTIRGSREEVLDYIGNPINWEANDDFVYPLNTWEFTFPDLGSSGGTITDYTMLTGGWSITGTVVDTHTGINSTGIWFEVYSPSTNLIVDSSFTNVFSDQPLISAHLATTVGAGNYANNATGEFFAVIRAVDRDSDRGSDGLATNLTVPFYVVDDDSDPPYFNTLTWNGKADLDINELASVVVTARVGDVENGVAFVSQPPHIIIFNDVGSVVYSNQFTQPGGFSDGAASGTDTALIWTPALNLSAQLSCGIYTCRVVMTDNDNDRPNDGAQLVYETTLALSDASGAPTALVGLDIEELPAAGAVLTDGELHDGGWALAVTFTNTAAPILTSGPEQPRHVIVNAGGAEVYAGNWTNYVTAGGGFFATNDMVALGANSFDLIDLGTYDVESYAWSVSPCDYGLAATQQFSVVDDDIKVLPPPALAWGGQNVVLVLDGFETETGWATILTGTSGFSTLTGNWDLTEVAATAGGSSNSPGYRIDLVTGSMLGLPPVEDAGTLFFSVRGTSGAQPNQFTVDYQINGAGAWFNVGFTQSVASLVYTQVAFAVNVEGPVTVRLRAVQVNDTLLMVDDLALTKLLPWTNGETLALGWNAVTDPSGVSAYHIAHNAAAAPLGITEGLAVVNTSAEVTNALEGVITGYVFTVDADLDRPGDQARSMNVPYIARIDRTPPLVVASFDASNEQEDVEDPSRQVRLTWAPASANEAIAAGRRSDGEPLSPFASYRVYYAENEDRAVTTNDVFLEASADNYGELASHLTSEITLTELIPGYRYSLAVAGVDEAGNVSPLSGSVTVLMSIFNIDTAYAEEDNSVTIEWFGREGVVYDVIYAENTIGYGVEVESSWRLAATVTGTPVITAFTDEGDVPNGRVHPRDLTAGMMRFYRVAPVSAWIPGAGRDGVASEDIVVAHAIGLSISNNFVGLSVQPYETTIEKVFGTRRLPTFGDDMDDVDVAKVDLYSASPKADADAVRYSLITTPTPGEFQWMASIDGLQVNNANGETLPYEFRGFNIYVPAATKFLMVGRVPPHTNAVSAVSLIGGSYNFLSLNAPRVVKLKDLNIKSLLQPGYNPLDSDEIRVMENTRAPFGSPRLRAFVDIVSGRFVSQVSGVLVDREEEPVYPNEVIIVRMNSGRSFPVDFAPATLNLYPAPSILITNVFPAAPTVRALAAGVTGTVATLRASVNPNSRDTDAWFVYGTTPDYEFTTSVQQVTAAGGVDTVEASISGLISGYRYYFQIVASNAYGVSRGGTGSFQVDCPNIIMGGTTNLPAGYLGSTYSNNFIATGGQMPYTYAISGGRLPDGLTLSDAGVLSGIPTKAGIFSLVVTVFDNRGCAGAASFVIEVINNASTVPDAPTGLSASSGTSGDSITLAWTDTGDEDGYAIWRGTNPSSGLATFIASRPANVIAWTDYGTTPGQLYYYWLKATNTQGSSSFSAPADGYRKLGLVSGVTATTNLTTAIQVSWTTNLGATGYAIYRGDGTVGAGSMALLASVPAGTNAYWDTDISLQPERPYFYWVRATNSSSASMSDLGEFATGLLVPNGSHGAGLTVGISTVTNIITTLGGNSLSRFLYITNNGFDTLNYTISVTYSNGFGWLQIDPLTGSLSPGISTRHTNIVLGSMMNATGVYFATVTVTGNQTNPPVVYQVKATVNAIAQPTNVQAVPQGTNTIALSWTKASNRDVMIVHREGTPPADPIQGTFYAVSESVGGGTVVYRGSATSFVHAGLMAGANHYYAFYSINSDRYSTAVIRNAVLP